VEDQDKQSQYDDMIRMAG